MASAESANMRAILVQNGKGPASSLYLGEAPTPRLDGPEAKDEVLVQVKAAGVNRMDIMQRQSGATHGIRIVC